MRLLNLTDQQTKVSLKEISELLLIIFALLSVLSPNPLVLWWRFLCDF